MTTFSWFSGKRESSRKYMGSSPFEKGDGSESGGADDSRALHLADGGPVVLDGVVLGVAVVPDREAVLRPPPAHLELRNRRLPDQIVEQFARTRRVVVAESHLLRRVVIREVRRERIHEQDLLACLGVGADHGGLGVREPLVQGVPP